MGYTRMLLGYNTNGLAHHDPLQAIELLAEIGYRSVAITIDHGTLEPVPLGTRRQLGQVKRLLARLGLRSVIETGARFLLDPRHKHEPTLVSREAADRRRRVEFLKYAVDVAQALESDCVSLWSGTLRDGATRQEAFARLEEGLGELSDYANQRNVAIGFEPEPGMLVDTMAGYEELLRRLPDGGLQLTLDIGHLHCQGELPIADHIGRWAGRLVNMHIEDMRAGRHEHLMFGEGEIEFPPVIEALHEIDYRGGIHVELSRHSHEGPQAARRAFEFLSRLLDRPA